jgi:hypothetical protein
MAVAKLGRRNRPMGITVKLSVGFSRQIERTIPHGSKPTVGSLLYGIPLEAFGVNDFCIEVNGRSADSNTLLCENDHIELITPEGRESTMPVRRVGGQFVSTPKDGLFRCPTSTCRRQVKVGDVATLCQISEGGSWLDNAMRKAAGEGSRRVIAAVIQLPCSCYVSVEVSARGKIALVVSAPDDGIETEATAHY